MREIRTIWHIWSIVLGKIKNCDWTLQYCTFKLWLKIYRSYMFYELKYVASVLHHENIHQETRERAMLLIMYVTHDQNASF